MKPIDWEKHWRGQKARPTAPTHPAKAAYDGHVPSAFAGEAASPKAFKLIAGQPVAFGSIGNSMSIDDLKDLMAAKDVALSNLDKAAAEVSQSPLDLTSVANEIDALKARYATARANAQSAIDLAAWNVTPNSLIDATAQYNAILTALNPTWQQNAPAPGSIDAIYGELVQAGATGKDDAPIPQPTATDYTLEAYKVADTTAKAETAAAGAAASAASTAVNAAAGQIGRGFLANLNWKTGALLGGAAFVAGKVLRIF